MLMLDIISVLFSNPYAVANSLIGSYGYPAVFVLMLLEGSSLPCRARQSSRWRAISRPRAR